MDAGGKAMLDAKAELTTVSEHFLTPSLGKSVVS